jgi:hypothetical protein
MDKALIKVFDTEGVFPKDWSERIEIINNRLKPHNKECEFDIEYIEIGKIPLGNIKIRKSEKDGEEKTYIYPDLEWLRRNFYKRAQDYDQCVVHFENDSLENIVIGADNDLGGWSAGDKFGVVEVIMRGRTNKEWAKRFLHETGHSTADYFMGGVADETHYYDYDLKDFDAWIAKWDWSQLKANKKTSINIIRKHIDIDWSADNQWNEETYFKNDNDQSSIVLHTLLGTVMGSYSWLDAINLSYHYLIDTNGSIYEQVSPLHGAWHAGRVVRPNERAQSFYGKYGRLGNQAANPNRHSIGIAFARQGQVLLNESQARSAVELINHLGRKYGQEYTAENIFAHPEITAGKPKEVLKYREQVLQLGEDRRGTTGGKEPGINIDPDTIKKAGMLVKPLKWLSRNLHILFPSK